ncbi:MAG: cation:proton antiporter [Rickettsiaceae bacterium]|nr:cation:proton antiporter [Rickettsiaceae bacterium]
MKMDDDIILRTIIKVIVPFMFMFGLYVQFHGEQSPGGGFQAGVICAAALITYGLVHGLGDLTKIVSVNLVKFLSSVGVLIYGGTGVVTMLHGDKFLAYSSLSQDSLLGQQVGMMAVEIGVGVTVFSVVMLIFYMFAERSK